MIFFMLLRLCVCLSQSHKSFNKLCSRDTSAGRDLCLTYFFFLSLSPTAAIGWWLSTNHTAGVHPPLRHCFALVVSQRLLHHSPHLLHLMRFLLWLSTFGVKSSEQQQHQILLLQVRNIFLFFFLLIVSWMPERLNMPQDSVTALLLLLRA